MKNCGCQRHILYHGFNSKESAVFIPASWPDRHNASPVIQ